MTKWLGPDLLQHLLFLAFWFISVLPSAAVVDISLEGALADTAYSLEL